ncbi:unnamed protein product, partial [Protopolystoma xenopodis]
VDGVASSCLFTVVDGHSGPSCSHVLAWSLLDYVAAACLDSAKLTAALNYWASPLAATGQPYHLSRRLDLFEPSTGRRLGHAANSPGPELRTHLRNRLQAYMRELVSRPHRSSIES